MPEINETIFVTGANGFVGRNLLPALVDEDVVIRAGFMPGETPQFSHPKVTWIEGDIRDAETMKIAIAGCDTIVHLAGIVANPDPALNKSINTEATVNLLEAGKAAGCERFLFMSAAAAKFSHPNAYGQSKKAAEEAIAVGGINWASLRTPLIIGHGSEEFDRFIDFVKKIPLIVPIFGSGSVIKRPVCILDVVAALMAIIKREQLGNCIYEVACPENVTLDEFVDAILASEGLNKIKLHIPVGFSLLLARVAESVLGHRSPVTQDIIRGLNEDVLFDTHETVTGLGLDPKSLVECLKEN